MPLIVQPDGSLIEGPIPSGGTKVLALDQGEVKEVFVAVNPPSVGGEVVNERLQYDLPEIFPRAIPLNSLVLYVSEGLPELTEEVVAALLARAEETLPLVADDVTLEVAPIGDVVPIVTDDAMLATQANEEVPLIEDSIEAMVLVLDELVPEQTEVVRVTAGVNAMEVVPDLQEDVASAIVVGNEIVPTQQDDVNLTLILDEENPIPIEDVNILATVNAMEVVPDLADQTEAAIVVLDEIVPNQGDEIVINLTLNGYANANVSNTGWTNQGNILGNTTNTSASLTATSSGLLGTTNNTTNGTTVLGFRDVNLGDLTITSVVLNAENSGAGAGVAIAQPTVNIQYQYSTNNGSTWTTFYTHTATALAKGVRTINLTSIIGQNQSLINNFQVRATGTVTSGTGVGAAYTASFFRTWLVITASRTYP